MERKIKGVVALSPVLVLLAVYLVGSLLAGDFYRIPVALAFVVALIYGMFLLKGMPFRARINVMSEGAASSDIMYMVWIFCMAGIFAASAKAVGAVDATVALTLKLVPARFIPAGIFIATCFVSMAIGTSVGTIVALIPVVTVMAPQIGCQIGWLVAVVVGGAFFGDNLSFISDTTIAATQTQGCSMSDKFKTNFMIVLPAAIVALVLYLCGDQSQNIEYVASSQSIDWIKAVPYLLVIVLALLGINVLKVLFIGILCVDLIALFSGSDLLSLLVSAGEGLNSMSELIVVTLLAGALMNVVRRNEGFDYLIKSLTSCIHTKRGAEAIVALLTALTNVCTANNTVAILSTGPIVRDMAQRYGVSARKTASLMDTASCCVQGLLPYGAQLLMASALASVGVMEIIPHLYYPMMIGCMVVLSIIFDFPRK